MKSDNARTDKTITQLKNKKAPGPDKIPNEIFTHANHQTRETYLKEINKLIQTYKIPDQWQIVEIKKICKGKGKTYGGETWEMTKQESINQSVCEIPDHRVAHVIAWWSVTCCN